MQATLVTSKTTTQTKLFQPCGHVNASNASAFKQQLLAAIYTEDYDAIQVDMSQVDSLDSAGLMALVAALSSSQQINKPFSLCSISPSIRIIFELTQLDRVFDIR